MKIAYKAFDRSGRPVNDLIDAADAADASERLRRQGLYITELQPVSGGEHRANTPSERRDGATRLPLPRRRHKCLAMFTRQLQVLVSTGTPLVQSLAALERQSQDAAWKAIVADVRRRVEEGASLASAIEAHPQCFDAIYRSLVAAGEASGHLDAMLKRLTVLTRQQMRIRSSIVSTITYPCLLVVVAVGVLGLMLGFILPRFAGLYETLDSPLPPSTQLLMLLSAALRQYWWAMLGVLIPAAVATRFWLRTPNGRRMMDTVAIRAPQFGTIVQSFCTARLTRVLGVLTESHVPLLDALTLARESAGNSHYAKLIVTAEESVTRGESMSAAFAASSLINPYVTEAIRNGEQSGQVAPLLLSIADFLDEENEVVIKSLTSIIEPLILIGLGLMVGAIALSMFLPLFDLTAAAGGP